MFEIGLNTPIKVIRMFEIGINTPIKVIRMFEIGINTPIKVIRMFETGINTPIKVIRMFEIGIKIIFHFCCNSINSEPSHQTFEQHHGFLPCSKQCTVILTNAFERISVYCLVCRTQSIKAGTWDDNSSCNLLNMASLLTG